MLNFALEKIRIVEYWYKDVSCISKVFIRHRVIKFGIDEADLINKHSKKEGQGMVDTTMAV